MSIGVHVLLGLVVAIALSSASIIAEHGEENFNMENVKDSKAMSALLFRNKREDIIKLLVDAVDSDIDKCGSPLQIQRSQVTISVKSLTCIVQALVDSLNAGPGLLRRLLDNIFSKRDLSAVEMKQPFTKTDQDCVMKAIIKQAIDVIKEQHEDHKRLKRWSFGKSNRCAKIENEIEQAMKNQKQKSKN